MKKWNISASISVAEEFDKLADQHGDKSLLGTLACLLVIQLEPDQRSKYLKALKIARIESEDTGRSFLEEAMGRFQAVTTPQASAATTPPSRPPSEAQMIRDSDELFEEEKAMEDKRHPPKPKKGTKHSA